MSKSEITHPLITDSFGNFKHSCINYVAYICEVIFQTSYPIIDSLIRQSCMFVITRESKETKHVKALLR